MAAHYAAAPSPAASVADVCSQNTSYACPAWADPTDGTTATPPVLSDDEATTYVGTDAGTLYAGTEDGRLVAYALPS